MITEDWVLAKCSPTATKIVNGIQSDCLFYQKPLSHMGFFSALFAEVEQLCGRFFFKRNLLVKADEKNPNKPNKTPKNKQAITKNLTPFQSLAHGNRWWLYIFPSFMSLYC